MTIIVTGYVYGMMNYGDRMIPVVAEGEGESIPLYSLPLGSQVLIVKANDLAGDTSSETLYETTTSVDSLKALVTYFVGSGWLDPADTANNLCAKLANNDLKSFVKEVNNQRGMHIADEAAHYLLRDAQYLIVSKIQATKITD
ncbi:hypothetical protein PAECIP111891_00480 [Paenibacillus allorhizoplanae]|uniref:Uncharacterized protein n=1 Tax=Paenibacillus allorhizoplanae TaxID=2905648 RepID=A0ABN8G041_9BACL|nr:hypothetical protein [Paenibacillus allorhizoplanae]CAH1193046.1 hypothetical protein PAECIP111891_00480 [Paenibacillus allorhizoplanae]